MKKKYKFTYKPGYLTAAGEKQLESNIKLAYSGKYKKEITKQYFKDTYGLNIDFGKFIFKNLSEAELGIVPLKEGEQQKLVAFPTCTAKGKQHPERKPSDHCYLLSYDNKIIEKLFCNSAYKSQAIPKPSASKQYEQYIYYEKKFSLMAAGIKDLHKITKGESAFYDFSGSQKSSKKADIARAVIQVAELPPQKFWFYDGAHSNLVSHYNIDGKSYFFIFDSMKYSETPGSYYERDDGYIVTPNLALMSIQVKVLEALGKNIVINSEQRQNGPSTCHFFVQEDLETLKSYPQLHNEILVSSQKTSKSPFINLFKFPATMLKLTQSLSTLDEIRKKTVININEESITLERFINNHCEESIYGNPRNHYAQKLQYSFLERCELLEFFATEVYEDWMQAQIPNLIGKYLY